MTEQMIWLKNYPSGVPVNIRTDGFSTVVALLDDTLKKYKHKIAFSNMGRELTFEQVDKLSRDFGAYLHSRGLEPGDKIALMMPNLLQYPIALFGAFRAGLIVVNTNPLYTPREMKHQFKDSGVKAIVIAENFAANLEKILGDTSIKTVIITSLGEMLGMFKGRLVNMVVRRVKRLVPKFDIANAVTFKTALANGKKFKLPEIKAAAEDTVILQYTGGTTGISKGAMLTNKNLLANMEQIRAIMSPFLVEGKEVILAPLPLYHIFAFTVNCMTLMSYGSLNVLVTNPRDMKSVIKPFKMYPISVVVGVNTLFNAMINYKEFKKLDFSSLKMTLGGGMAVQKAVALEWQRITDSPLCEGYGMTEASPVITVNPLDGSGKLGTIGLPLPSTDVRIVNDEGRVVPQGQIGELQVKGPQVMKGYYNQPDETQKVLKDGWLSTGDIAKMHEDGYFQLVDRKKDMILVSGFNVFPNEIEDVIAMHPKVLEVAAIGIPDPKSNEVVKVFIVKKDKKLTEKEIIQHCRENLTGYKVPKSVEFRKELPKTNVGKILRRALREEEFRKGEK